MYPTSICVREKIKNMTILRYLWIFFNIKGITVVKMGIRQNLFEMVLSIYNKS